MSKEADRQNVVWHGSEADGSTLRIIVGQNCACEFGLLGMRLKTCGPHEMLLSDQRALNGLLFAKKIAQQLMIEEFSGETPATSHNSTISTNRKFRATLSGSAKQIIELVRIVSRNCSCEHIEVDLEEANCPVHKMYREDQRALNGLAWFRGIASKLVDEEFCNGNFGPLSKTELEFEVERYLGVKQRVAEDTRAAEI